MTAIAHDTGEHSADTLRVLYLSWRDSGHPEAGGAETFAERTAQVLHQRGNDVTIFTSRFPGSSRTADHDGVRIVRGGGRYDCYLHALRYAWTHRRDFDVVLDVQNGVPFWSPLLRALPVVNLTHHSHHDQWRVIFGPAIGRVGWFLESRIAPVVYRRSRYVTVSQASRSDLENLGVDGDRIDVVYNGLDDPPHPSGGPVQRADAPTMVVLSRLVPHKQIEIAIDTLAALRTRHPGLSLDIVGTGYWHDRLVQHAQDAGVRDAVRFHGFVDEDTKHRLLARAWLMLMPSEKEGWGLTILEAAQHGTPSVAFSCAGGPKESVLHGTTGLLADGADEFVRHTEDLLSSADLRHALGRGARTYAGGFDWQVAGAKLERTLLRAAGRGSARLRRAAGSAVSRRTARHAADAARARVAPAREDMPA